ncbi:MAG: phosphatase PAP2 family protein [Chloroflexota bacterium]
MPDFLYQLDKTVFYAINLGWANPVFDWLMPFITNLKNLLPLYLFMFGFIIYDKGKGSVFIILAIVVAVGMNDQLSSGLFKHLFERARPCRELEIIRRLVGCGPGFSFPSSHASNSFALATVLTYYYRRGSKWFYSAAALIALSRVYVGVHYPIDIFGGTLIGLLDGGFVVLALKTFRREHPANRKLRFPA